MLRQFSWLKKSRERLCWYYLEISEEISPPGVEAGVILYDGLHLRAEAQCRSRGLESVSGDDLNPPERSSLRVKLVVEHVSADQLLVQGQDGKLHGLECLLSTGQSPDPGGELGVLVLQLLQSDLNYAQVQGGPGVDGEGQGDVHVVMVVPAGTVRLQASQCSRGGGGHGETSGEAILGLGLGLHVVNTRLTDLTGYLSISSSVLGGLSRATGRLYWTALGCTGLYWLCCTLKHPAIYNEARQGQANIKIWNLSHPAGAEIS